MSQGTVQVTTGKAKTSNTAPQQADNNVRVGFLAPLSGPNQQLGQALLNAATLATYDVADTHLEILPFDTAGNPAQAVQAAQAAAQSGAQALLGPLTAAEVQAIKPVTQLPLLSFSTDTSLADVHTYLIGFPVENQIIRVLDYAALHGMTRIVVIAPTNAFGDVVMTAAQNFQDVSPTVVLTVLRTHSDVARTVAAVASAAPQAILLADTSPALLKALAPLKQTSPTLKYLGTGLWDDAALQRLPALQGGLYASSDPARRANFTAHYQAAFGATPPRLASLGYDAAALAAVLVHRYATEGAFRRSMLTSANGFDGVDGIFRLTDESVAERGLAILEITDVGTHVVDPAPATFQN